MGGKEEKDGEGSETTAFSNIPQIDLEVATTCGLIFHFSLHGID